MNKTSQSLTYALFLILASFQFTSCSKDSDLLSDYVINEEVAEFKNLVVNDNFYIAQGQSAILDVLQNDQFSVLENVTIIGTTAPQNGTVTINDDNTLTYTANTTEPQPEAAPEEGLPDTFEYTAEQNTENGETVNENGTVNINNASRAPQVNFSEYGAVGDGITDDTQALQNALNAESDLIAESGSTFLVTKTLNIDTQNNQVIEWNGSTMTTSTANLTFMEIDKRAVNGGSTTMNNLLINARNVGMRGVRVLSRSVLNNIDGIDYGQTAAAGNSPTHIIAEFFNNDADTHGDWIFDGCDVDGLLGFGSFCDYLDGIGAANGYLVYWRAVPTTATTITYKNGSSMNGYGPDGQNVGVFSAGGVDVSNTLASTVFDNITTSGFDRRGWKLFCGNVTVKNSTINAGLFSDGNDKWDGVCTGIGGLVPAGGLTDSSGLVAVGSGSGSNGGENIVFENVTFNGVASNGDDNRVIPIDTDEMYFRNCTFNGGASIAMTRSIGNIDVCSTTFNSGSGISAYNQGSDRGQIRLDTDNIYADGFARAVNISVFSSIQTDLTCNPID